MRVEGIEASVAFYASFRDIRRLSGRSKMPIRSRTAPGLHAAAGPAGVAAYLPEQWQVRFVDENLAVRPRRISNGRKPCSSAACTSSASR